MFIPETTSFHYFSPKDSESLKILDIQLWEVGANRRLNGDINFTCLIIVVYFLKYYIKLYYVLDGSDCSAKIGNFCS